jgi:hypothetical protein
LKLDQKSKVSTEGSTIADKPASIAGCDKGIGAGIGAGNKTGSKEGSTGAEKVKNQKDNTAGGTAGVDEGRNGDRPIVDVGERPCILKLDQKSKVKKEKRKPGGN